MSKKKELPYNLWDQPDTPHKGWTCVDIEDLGEPDGICEMCGQKEVRFLHVMEHPDCRSLKVGCVCAGKMEENYTGAKRRQKDALNKAKRKSKWLTRKWRLSEAGNIYLNYRGQNVGIGVWRGAHRYRIEGSFSEPFASSQQAKLALFDALNK